MRKRNVLQLAAVGAALVVVALLLTDGSDATPASGVLVARADKDLQPLVHAQASVDRVGALQPQHAGVSRKFHDVVAWMLSNGVMVESGSLPAPSRATVANQITGALEGVAQRRNELSLGNGVEPQALALLDELDAQYVAQLSELEADTFLLVGSGTFRGREIEIKRAFPRVRFVTMAACPGPGQQEVQVVFVLSLDEHEALAYTISKRKSSMRVTPHGR